MDGHLSFRESQRLIDEEIAELLATTQKSLLLLKTRRNTVAPVAKLSDDVLLKIFVLVRDSSDVRPQSWIQVTQICTYWRRLANDSPSLWTRLHDPSRSFAELMLKRSCGALLDVEFVKIEWKHSTILSVLAILEEIGRIRVLRLIHVHPWSIQQIHHAFGSRIAPVLELLQVDGVHYYPETPHTESVLCTIRPSQALRQLIIHRSCYDWSLLSTFIHLTCLEIHGKAVEATTGSQFVHTLSLMSNMESLTLDWSGIRIQHFPPNLPARSLCLPQLRALVIWAGDQAHIEAFMSLLDHPKLETLVLDPSENPADLATLVQCVVSSAQRSNMSSLECLSITLDRITISSFHGEHGTNHHGSCIQIPRLFLFRQGPPKFELAELAMSSLKPWTCLNGIIPVRRLILGDWDIPLRKFIRLFADLPYLESVEAYQKDVWTLFKAMTIPESEARSSTSTAPILFPRLKSIICHGMLGGYPRRNHTTAPLPDDKYEKMYRSLVARRNLGASITDLELIKCATIDQHRVKQLNEIGTNVVFR